MPFGVGDFIFKRRFDMRPPAIEKCGFYKTSQTVAQLLTKYFKPADSGRLLDPCAGEGTAASILAKALNCQSWGAELSPARAALAAETMDRLFNTPWSSCHLTGESITLLFLNPPYSHDRLGDQKRLELEFLKSTTPKLMRGGVLIYIVPHPLLRDLDVASHLAGYYENIRIYRYPDSGFNQVIVLATRRVKYKIPSHEEVHQVQAWADVEPPMLVEVDEPLYELLPATDKGSGGQPIRFSRLDWQPEEIVDATQKRGLQSSKEWLDLLNPSRGLGELKQPVMPLKKGHIAMLMASGMMGTLRLTDEDGKPMLVKGRVVKVTEKVEENTDKKGNVISEIFRDRFVSTVAILRQSGIEIIDTVDPLSKFMHKYGDQIGAHILSTYRPLYNFDPTPEETAILDTLGTKRKPLPGQEKAGLLPAQRHAVTAMARSIRKHGVGNVQGEMGWGKAGRITSRIYTPDGYKLMGEIKVGDQVINPDGGYANVIGVFPQGVMDIYRVTFSDGSSTEVTQDHLWAVNSPLRKWRGRPLQIKSLREIMSKPLIHPTTGNYQVFIPMVQPVEFSKRELPLDPYLLGVLLGDGSLTKSTIFFTSCDQEILDEVVRLLPEGVTLKPHGRCNWFCSSDGRTKPDGLQHALITLGLKGHLAAEKFIPDCYLYSGVQDRLALLQGLCDTDGSVSNNGAVEYVTISNELALNIKELVQSLGGTVTLSRRIPIYMYKGEKRQGRLAYRLYIKLPSSIMPFRLSRKANIYRPAGKYEPHRSIVNIEHVGQDYAQCIMLDSENQLYVTDEYIVTHNTTIGSGVVELLDAYPAIVLCPPHLVPKWIREIEETIPGAKAMEITRIGRNADDPGDVNDVRRFLKLYKSGELGKKPVAVIAHTSAKYGAGWEHAVVRKMLVDDDGRVFEALCCPTCGSPIQIELPGGFVKMANILDDLGDKRRFCEVEISGYELDEQKRLKHDERGNPIWGKRKCGTPLFQFTGRRWAIADYIAKHAKGDFKLLVADELQKFQAKATDSGVAFQQLVKATKYTLTLTGTFFGGKSTSIFWLLHRLNAGVRKDFAFNDEKRWARLYGVLEMTRKSKRTEEDGDEDGYTGNRRYQNQAKEQPGISPAIVNRLLDTTVFLSLKDLGLALPHYAEEVVTLEMTDEQSSQYRVMAKKLYDLAIKNRRYLSTWLQWTLARPNSAFRDEVVEVDEVNQKGEVIRRKELMELPAVVDRETMPKESWLVDFCRAERQQGRKVLIYLRQTGTRDIQDRILKVLRNSGVRAEVLTSGVNPRKREEWIAKRVVGLDALVVNPRLVETGLDLVAFSSVVFAEIEYSLYTLWQAVRRVWRLGQTKPVKAIFSVYSEAMEARALALMGQKMKAAQLLYGDDVGGAIVLEDDGDILMKLAREALESADLPDLQKLFADEVAVSNSPMGCPTVPSVLLPVPIVPKTVSWSDWMTQRGVVGRSASRSRSKEVTQNQVSLF
ncbi:MAG: hypothetical protein KJZ77_04835 [Anaerolineales bacterium]|nr:hypothetical protein [Anaerolineales bacterium]